MVRVKIVLDADVLIHFAKGGCLSLLPTILSEFEHIVLSTVYEEIKSVRHQLDNQINLLGNISKENFAPTGEMRREYARLLTRFGSGESACMSYCRYTNNVIGSSNLKDIKDYCADQGISYLTTLDFLYYAIRRGKMTREECTRFICEVRSKGSRLPDFDFDRYIPNFIPLNG